MAELGQQTVEFSTLVSRAAEDSFLSLKELVDKSKTTQQSDSDKKISLLKYLVHTQQQDVGIQGTLTEVQQKPALRKLDTLVQSKLLEVSLPKEISKVKVSDGTALLRVDGEFKVLVTLGYRGHLSMWRILHMELLVGERSGSVKLEELRRHVLGDDLERRMAAAENPFTILYSVLHELCVALVMDTVLRQVQALRQGRWKDVIRFELISDSSSSNATQLNQDGEADSAGLRTPGPDLQIKCIHSTFVIDPLNGRGAEFSLDQSCIDVEKLLLRAICCNRYTRLLEIQKELGKNVQICRAAGDIILQFHMDEPDVDHKKKETKSDGGDQEGQEVLHVRAYGSSFFTLGINIRNGRFLLRSSQNIITPSVLIDFEEALNQGSITAAEVFISLRSKSILHLFASIGRFLGLEVYEHGFAAVKVPKNLLNGSTMLLMGFPDCGNLYFLLAQLDKDFKPLFKLLETQPDPSGKVHSSNDSTAVMRMKKIDVNQMQMLEDDLSIVDLGKLNHLLPNASPYNQTSEHGLLSEFRLEGLMPIAGCPPSSFSSVVDEVFELEKGASVPSFPLQNVTSFNASPASHFGSVLMNLHTIKAGTPSPKWEAGMQGSQVNSVAKVSSVASHYNGSLYPSNNLKGSVHSSSFSSLSSGLGRTTAVKILSASKSDQDLSSLRSQHLVEVGTNSAMDDDHLRLLNDASKDALSGIRPSRLSSPSPPTGSRISASNVKPIGARSSPAGSVFRVAGSSPLATTSVSHTAGETAVSLGSSHDLSIHEKNPRKRTVLDMLSMIPSLQDIDAKAGFSKRRRTSESAHFQQVSSRMLVSSEMVYKNERYSYGNLIAEANKGNSPSSIYVSALLHMVRHCSLSIKHARLTSQMDDLDIPYVEEVGLRSASSNIWFRLPLARGDSWQHICLRLGRPGSMHWDIKINDQHFRDLWELQKGSSGTPWGSGVHIANASDVDSHIRYDPDGVVLSYQSVESDSIKKLVADIQRLSNARMFALGMRKLLGVRADEKLEESSANSDLKLPIGGKNAPEGVGADKLFEQMRRAFRIEAVGLMSLWFSFGSGVLARFVVEWESGKEGCTLHVLPDQLWPHTKFLEDFINGAEVASLLDCIRLTAGPLHALAAATRPARAGPAPAVPGATATVASMPKQAGYIQSQGLLPSGLVNNISQLTSGPVSNVSSSTGPLGNHNPHNVAMLAATGRGGPGIVPSSLLPIDVSVVLRGPYWIRIIYRKHFAVDMRCFAGDQVWLQPATPPKGGPSVGGSLPCPQFRPFIMEHVAQELNGLDPGFAGGHQTVGLGNSNNPNPSSCSQLSSVNGNRVNLPNSSATSRAANQVAALNRVGNAVPGSSNLAVLSSGLPIRRSPGVGVPAHVRGELNTAIIGLGDDGGYGGGWVPLVALKKVLRGILKYLGVLWLFAQLPGLLKEILGSILKENEGALLNLDQEQPALRFFVGGYVFAVSVHRVQLLLQVLSVKRFHHQQQQQQQQNSAAAQEELTQSEIGEICDYFSRRNSSAAKSNIHYDRPHNFVDFALTVVLDPAHIPHINAAGGAAWLPYCVSVRLRYLFGETMNVSFLGMEGSHGGRACWSHVDDWEKSKQRVAQTVEVKGSSTGDALGRLRVVAESVQKTLHTCLQGLRDGSGVTASSGTT
ncbi:hypothetical protein D5086_024284 [Populus alba]|uniref:Uncharacterized protein n=1 Tax=Populus alba TaxID=43335 RepID=A0ACC4B5P7_POPAL